MSDALERANLLVDELRRGIDWAGVSPRDQHRQIVDVIGDLIHDLANAQQRCIALEYQIDQLRASVVDALSSAGPEVAEDERAG